VENMRKPRKRRKDTPKRACNKRKPCSEDILRGGNGDFGMVST
jgi:hypothetical protein